MFRKKTMVILGAGLALGLAVSAVAQTAPPSQGLGTSWPAAQDVSANPSYHVYRWVQGGVKYLQVNDVAGNVKFAVGQVGGVVFVLPVGTPQNVQVVQPAAAPTSGSNATLAPATSTVYSDSTITVQQTPTTYVVSPKAAATCTNPVDCSG